MRESKPVDGKSLYCCETEERSSGYHHGPHESYKHKGASDTGMKICQGPKTE